MFIEENGKRKKLLTKMKVKPVFLVIGCLCTTLIGCVQNNDHLKTSLRLMQNSPEFQFSLDSTGFSKIKNLKFYSAIDSTVIPTPNSNNIHVVDFNNDGYKDIIYQNKEHYPETKLFVRKGNNFMELCSYAGALVKIKQDKETTIYVLKQAIGCDVFSELIQLTINNNNAITKSTITYHYNTKIETTNPIFEQKKISGILRLQPIIDDTNKIDPCSGDLINGNQLKTIENKIVTIIKTHKNWSLVLYKEKNNSTIGWIKN